MPSNEEIIKEKVLADISEAIRSAELNIPPFVVLDGLRKKFENILFWAIIVYISVFIVLLELAIDYLKYLYPSKTNLLVAGMVYISATSLINVLKVDIHRLLSENSKVKEKVMMSFLALITPYALFDFLPFPKPSFNKYPYVLPYKECRGIPEVCKSKKDKCITKCFFIRFAEKLVSDYEVFRIHSRLSSEDSPITDYSVIIKNLDYMMNESLPSSISEIKNSYIVFDKKKERVSILMMILQKIVEKKTGKEIDTEHPTLNKVRVIEEINSIYYASILEWGFEGSVVWDILLQIEEECSK